MAEMFELDPLEADRASFSATEITDKLLALKKRFQEQKEQILSLQSLPANYTHLTLKLTN